MKTSDKLKLINSAFDSLRWAFDITITLTPSWKCARAGKRVIAADYAKYPRPPSVPQMPSYSPAHRGISQRPQSTGRQHYLHAEVLLQALNGGISGKSVTRA